MVQEISEGLQRQVISTPVTKTDVPSKSRSTGQIVEESQGDSERKTTVPRDGTTQKLMNATPLRPVWELFSPFKKNPNTSLKSK